MIAITMRTIKLGKLITIKIPTINEQEILAHYGKKWHKVDKIKRNDGVSFIEIIQFNNITISRFNKMMDIIQ